MAQYSSFFNAIETSAGVFDRTYNASEWAEYFSSLIGNGVFANPSTNLQVSAGSGMQIIAATGTGFINGYFYKNTEALNIPINAADLTYSRITNIVLELNLNNRNIIITTVDGSPAPTPTAPALIRSGGIYQLCLAQVTIPSQSLSIIQSQIQDTRLLNDLCGVVASTVQHLDTSTLYQNWQSSFESWFNALQGQVSESELGSIQQLLTSISKLNEEVESINTKTSVQSLTNEDFNNIYAQGIYVCDTDSAVSNYSNCPSTNAGYLVVNTSGQSNFTYQEWTDFKGNKFYRSFYAYNNTWSDWNTIVSTSPTINIGGMNLINGPSYYPYGLTSSQYGFSQGTAYLWANQEYTLQICGYISQAAQSANQSLQVYVYSENWTESWSAAIDTLYLNNASISFTPQHTANYYVMAYAANNATAEQTVTLYSMQVQHGNIATDHQLSIYDVEQLVKSPTSQLEVLAPQVVNLSLESSRLDSQNKIIGGQVSKLTLDNYKLSSQNKMLGGQVVGLSLESSRLSSQNKMLGNQVVGLSLENSQLSAQNKMLGAQVCKLTLDSSQESLKLKTIAKMLVENSLKEN